MMSKPDHKDEFTALPTWVKHNAELLRRRAETLAELAEGTTRPFICGPMTGCVSFIGGKKDSNLNKFDLYRQYLKKEIKRSVHVCSQLDAQHELEEMLTQKFAHLPDHIWAGFLSFDLTTLALGSSEIDFMPPAFTEKSVQLPSGEATEMRPWDESNGACLEAIVALELGFEFNQGALNEKFDFAARTDLEHAFYTIPIERECVRQFISASPTQIGKYLQQSFQPGEKGYKPMGAQPLSGEESTPNPIAADHPVFEKVPEDPIVDILTERLSLNGETPLFHVPLAATGTEPSTDELRVQIANVSCATERVVVPAKTGTEPQIDWTKSRSASLLVFVAVCLGHDILEAQADGSLKTLSLDVLWPTLAHSEFGQQFQHHPETYEACVIKARV